MAALTMEVLYESADVVYFELNQKFPNRLSDAEEEFRLAYT